MTGGDADERKYSRFVLGSEHCMNHESADDEKVMAVTITQVLERLEISMSNERRHTVDTTKPQTNKNLNKRPEPEV